MADRRTRVVDADTLGLRKVLGDPALPMMVAAMAFLAALALGTAIGAESWAQRWRLGAGAAATVQVPEPQETDGGRQDRLTRVLGVLRAAPALEVHVLDREELATTLRPWLQGTDLTGVAGHAAGGASNASATQSDAVATLLPAVIAIRWVPGTDTDRLSGLARDIAIAASGASLDQDAVWAGRLRDLLRALEESGWGALALVGVVATLVVASATRSALVARAQAVEILHGLGATDRYVARDFARRAAGLAGVGGLLGALAALPLLLELARRAGPLTGGEPSSALEWRVLPLPLCAGLMAIPCLAGVLGYLTAQATVRLWLQRLP